MPKVKTQYECQNCAAAFSKWQGQCTNCGQWNTLVESVVTKQSKSTFSGAPISTRVYKLSEVESVKADRMEVGSSELSQVLGGGLVRGSVVLLAGEPGIGKSTILTQLTLYFASAHGKVLYVCGEESAQQVKLRLERLSVHKKTTDQAKENILLFPETRTEAVIEIMEREKPALTIIDSIQTLVSQDLTGMAGSVGQVRESGNRVLKTAKHNGLSTFIVGHVTKEGSLAGPKVLEHMVDGVLYLTGERSSTLRLLRAVKNRFGAVDEVGVFEMAETGLRDVSNPSSVFLDEVQVGVPGSAVTVLMEGTRPILGEIQALVVPSSLPTPRRVAEGVKLSRVQVICAVLMKRCGLKLGDKDIFVNAAGGIRAHEPAADLAIALAIASSTKEKPVQEGSVVVGEVGLLGEVRKTSFMDKRIKEAKKLGYSKVISGQEHKQLYSLVKAALG